MFGADDGDRIVVDLAVTVRWENATAHANLASSRALSSKDGDVLNKLGASGLKNLLYYIQVV